MKNKIIKAIGRRPKVIPKLGKLEVDYIEDKAFSDKLFRLVLLALELSEMSDKEAREFQKGFLD